MGARVWGVGGVGSRGLGVGIVSRQDSLSWWAGRVVASGVYLVAYTLAYPYLAGSGSSRASSSRLTSAVG